MRLKLWKTWSNLRSNYWFLPTLMAVISVVAAFVTLYIDYRYQPKLASGIPGFDGIQPEGARAVLATVAGSMITVAGITFSMTLLAFSHASTQFGPRLLGNFMRDRGNQSALGIYIATFLYCLVILRSVRSSKIEDDEVIITAFVPDFSVLVALILTVSTVGVLIYYIHHVAENLRLPSILATVGRQLHDELDTLFPEQIGDPADSATVPPPDANLLRQLAAHAVAIPNSHAGFVQNIDEATLIEIAQKHDLVIEIACRPGLFAARGQSLLKVVPSEKVTAEVRERLTGVFACGIHRTPKQNTLFLVQQIAEMAARALSPGVNDPQTAIDCLEWIRSVLYQLRGRPDPNPFRMDDQRRLRVITVPTTYAAFLDASYTWLIPYFADDANAAKAMQQSLKWLIAHEGDADRRHLLESLADRLAASATE